MAILTTAASAKAAAAVSGGGAGCAVDGGFAVAVGYVLY